LSYSRKSEFFTKSSYYFILALIFNFNSFSLGIATFLEVTFLLISIEESLEI